MKKILVYILFLFVAFTVVVHADYLLKWDASEGANGYKIYFTDGTTGYQKDVGDALQCNLNELNIEPGVAYTYHVTAYNTCGESLPSDTVDFTRPSFETGGDNLPPYIIKTLNKVTITITQE